MTTTIHPAATADHIQGLQDNLAAVRAENTLLRKQLADVMEVVGAFAAQARTVFDTVGVEQPCAFCLGDEHAECERPVRTAGGRAPDLDPPGRVRRDGVLLRELFLVLMYHWPV